MKVIKESYRKFRTLCKAFPINIAINRINNSRIIAYLFYLLFIPLEFIWGLYMYISGLILDITWGGGGYNIAVVAIVKNEALYLDEWIAYHSIIGVEHFYIFNNNSEDNTEETLRKYVKMGLVTLVNLRGQTRQTDAYNYTILLHRKECKYLIVIDADEFLQIKEEKSTLLDLFDNLFKNKKVGGIGVNWNMFGSNGLRYYSNELVIKRFTRAGSLNNDSNHYIKSIINPRRVIGFFKSHAPSYWPGYNAVNIKGDYISGSRTRQVIHEPIRLNHYFTKSREEFEFKRDRGMADQKGKRDPNNFDRYDLNDIIDESMVAYEKHIVEWIEANKLGSFVKSSRK